MMAFGHLVTGNLISMDSKNNTIPLVNNPVLEDTAFQSSSQPPLDLI